MNKFNTVIAGAGLAIVATIPANAEEYVGPGFSAEIWSGTGEGAYKKTNRIYVDKPGMRLEALPPVRERITLMNWDARRVHYLLPDIGVYQTRQAKITYVGFKDEPCQNSESEKRLGQEMVDGRNAEKWFCVGQRRQPFAPPADVTRWYDRELNFIVREITDKGKKFEIRNVEIGLQDPSLFEIPSDFKKAD